MNTIGKQEIGNRKQEVDQNYGREKDERLGMGFGWGFIGPEGEIMNINDFYWIFLSKIIIDRTKISEI